MIKTVYLAGKMTGRRWSEIKAERARATVLLEAAGIEVLDPARGETFHDDKILDSGTLSTAPNGRSNVERDLRDVKQADATIVLTVDRRGFGTTVEWAYARFLGKPVFGVTAKSDTELGMWRVEMATAFFQSIEMLVEHLAAFWR